MNDPVSIALTIATWEFMKWFSPKFHRALFRLIGWKLHDNCRMCGTLNSQKVDLKNE